LYFESAGSRIYILIQTLFIDTLLYVGTIIVWNRIIYLFIKAATLAWSSDMWYSVLWEYTEHIKLHRCILAAGSTGVPIFATNNVIRRRGLLQKWNILRIDTYDISSRQRPPRLFMHNLFPLSLHARCHCYRTIANVLHDVFYDSPNSVRSWPCRLPEIGICQTTILWNAWHSFVHIQVKSVINKAFSGLWAVDWY